MSRSFIFQSYNTILAVSLVSFSFSTVLARNAVRPVERPSERTSESEGRAGPRAPSSEVRPSGLATTNTNLKASAQASLVVENASRAGGIECDAACVRTARGLEAMVRDPQSLNLDSRDAAVGSRVAARTNQLVSARWSINDAMKRALAEEKINAEDFEVACGR